MHDFATPGDAQREALWDASREVLRENRFALDRVDRRAGVISTHPVTSQQFFEFWRHDVDTPYDWWEASLHTVRRTVTIDIGFDKDAGASKTTVVVRRERFATPERQFNNSIAAFNVFGYGLPAARTGREVTAADNYWIDDGGDSELARYLLERIRTRVGAASE